jgi:hypothetical protein
MRLALAQYSMSADVKLNLAKALVSALPLPCTHNA